MEIKKSMSRLIVISFALFLLLGPSPVKTPCVGAETYQLVAASMGGVIYRWMAAVSKILNEDIKEAQFSVRTGSPKDNVLLLENGDLQISSVAPYSYNELHPDDPKFEKTIIRAVWPMFSLTRYLVVPKDSPFQSYDDLKGKKIAVGIKTAEGNDFVNMAKAMGWKDSDMVFFFIGKSEGIAAYKDGTVDAWTGWSTVPSPHFMQLAASRKGARLIPFKQSEISKIEKLFPSWVGSEIPGGTHKEIVEDSPTILSWFLVAARADFPEDIAYQIAKSIDNRLDEVVAVFKGARTATAENAAKYHFWKLHPGVLKYLKEKGLK